MNSLALAYFLYSSCWMIRLLLLIMMAFGIRQAWKGSKWMVIIMLIIAAAVSYMVNNKMVADHMFLQPTKVIMRNASSNVVEQDRLIIGIEHNGEARAYPIQFLGYHHQVQDTIAGKPIMVTYCTVCRSGRVFEPMVNGKKEKFRLVGMDHFNAMFEDHSTHSWWRQETGEAVAGKLKGSTLNEFPSTQTSLQTWLSWYPNSLIMQPDTTFKEAYAYESDFEKGRREGTLTVYDTTSWNEKSWVAGIMLNGESKAYDWNQLKATRLIHDVISQQPILVALGDEGKSLVALKRLSAEQQFQFRGDTLFDGTTKFALNGKSFDPVVKNLEQITVYQEYWHSWQTFHPTTTRYE